MTTGPISWRKRQRKSNPFLMLTRQEQCEILTKLIRRCPGCDAFTIAWNGESDDDPEGEFYEENEWFQCVFSDTTRYNILHNELTKIGVFIEWVNGVNFHIFTI